MIEITQADHDAAEEHFDVWYPDTAWGYDPLVEAFARHREAERARIVAWLFEYLDSGSVDGLICRSDGLDDFIAMLAQETQP